MAEGDVVRLDCTPAGADKVMDRVCKAIEEAAPRPLVSFAVVLLYGEGDEKVTTRTIDWQNANDVDLTTMLGSIEVIKARIMGMKAARWEATSE